MLFVLFRRLDCGNLPNTGRCDILNCICEILLQKGGDVRMKMVKDRDFYLLLLSISLPIALQNMVSQGVSLIGTLMLGQLGSTQIAASSLGNQPLFIFTLLTIGLAAGGSVLTAQYWGKGDTGAIRRLTAIVLRYSILASLLFAALVGFFPKVVMGFFTSDPEVLTEGALYLRITALAYPFYGITNTTLAILRSVERVWMSFWITLVSLLTTTFMNWVLIFGRFGLPAMGISGAAWAQVIARVVSFLAVLLYMGFHEDRIRIRLRDFFVHDPVLQGDFLRNASPVILNEFMWGFGSSAQAMILGHLGKQATTAHSISSALMQMAMVFIYGVTSASSVVMGKTLGANRMDKVRPYVNTLMILSAFIGLTAAGFILLTKGFFIEWYQIDAATKALTHQFMYIAAAVAMMQCLYSPVSLGALRAGGDTKFVLFLDVFFLWVLALPLGFMAAQVWQFAITPVYLLLKFDEPLKVLLAYWRAGGDRWIRNLTREIPVNGEV